MWTFSIVVVIGFLWWAARKRYTQGGQWRDRRRSAAWAWGMIGAVIGSFFGIAGLGNAIAGTIPGAIVGYLFASNLMKRDYDDCPESRIEPEPTPPAWSPALPHPPQSSQAIASSTWHSGPAIEYSVRPKSRFGGLWVFLGVMATGSAIWWAFGERKPEPPPQLLQAPLVQPKSVQPQTPTNVTPVTQVPRTPLTPTPRHGTSFAQSNADARSCLELRSNAAVARCARQ